ncbi:MAG: T9SS type A sorting domain-containing protein, partial [Ignavibacteriae bacterium]|nr:T9SS type A sorting domain-containing protein [Ignavibacteriota bacterium]
HAVFIQNKGQWSADVLYLARLKGVNTWITKQGIRYDFHKIELLNDGKSASLLLSQKTEQEGEIKGHVVDMICEGGTIANDIPGNVQKSYYNYIIGNDKSKWASFVPAFNEIIRHDIYSGIDQRLYFENGYIRYDFIVAPNAKTEDIVLSFKGAKGMNINSKGELVLQTSVGDVIQQKLYAYQMNGIEKQKVECSFEMKSNGKVGFRLAGYDKTKQIVIDPLLYSTFLGSSSIDKGNKLVVDRAGNAIVVGVVWGTNYPVHQGSYRRSLAGLSDVFITKFTPDLSEIIFSTYFGGLFTDEATSCALDAPENIIFGGTTSSRDIPQLLDDYDHVLGGSHDGFVAKLTDTGADLIFCTYLGGSKIDQIFDLVNVPITDDIIVVGETNSTDFPTLTGGYRTTNRPTAGTEAYNDGFVTKMNKRGTALIFSTLLGIDSAEDVCYGVTLDKNNYPIVVGSTANVSYTVAEIFAKNPFTTTANAIRRVNSNYKKSDGFFVKLGKNGNSLDYSTLVGGDSNDVCYGVDVDKDGFAVICGRTESKTGFNANGYDQTFEGISEGFVMRIGTGGGMMYSTFLGGSGEDEARCIKYLNASGAVIVGGIAGVGDLPTGKVNEMNYKGGGDAFIIQVSPNGRACEYLSYFGGTAFDEILSMQVYIDGTTYIAGYTFSFDMPTTSQAKFRGFNGDQDAFVSVINTCGIILDAPRDTIVCAGKLLTFTNHATGFGKVIYNWVDYMLGAAISTDSTVSFIPTDTNYYILTVTDDNCSKTITYKVTTKQQPSINTIEEKTTCIGKSIQLSAFTDPSNRILWFDSINAVTPSSTGLTYSTPILLKSTTVYVESQDTTTKCTSDRIPIKINVIPPPKEPFLDNLSICADNSVKISAIFPSDVNFKWYDSLSGGKLLQVGRDFITPKLSSTTTYFIESLDTITNCISSKRTPVVVNVLTTPNPIIQGQNAACVNSIEIEYSVAGTPKREYIWSITPNGTITKGLGTNKITVSWTGIGAGIISLTEKDLTTLCIKDAMYPVNISNRLTSKLSVIGSTKLCTGDSVIFDAGAGYIDYKWSNGEISRMITVKTAGDYSVEVQDAGGCKGNSNIESVTLSPLPVPEIVGQTSICINGTTVHYSVKSPNVANSYFWEISSEGVIVSGQGTPDVIVNWITVGTGTLKVIEHSLNCSGEKTLPVNVNTSLSPKITCSVTTLCEGESAQLDAGNYAKYVWSTGETTKTIQVAKSGIYTIDVEDEGGCKGTSQPFMMTVSPLPMPIITTSGKTELCEGDSVILDAGNYSSYLWSNGASSQKVTAKTTGKYSVTVTNSSGCKGISTEQIITVNQLPEIPVISQKGEDSLEVNPYDNAHSYKWKLNGVNTGQTAGVVFCESEGLYTVEVTNTSGCNTISLPYQYYKLMSAELTVSVSPLLIEAAAGETVRIPLVITSSKNLAQADASAFTAVLSVEPSVLIPKNGYSTVDNNRRLITINGTRREDNDTLAILELKAALGIVDSSPIILKSFVFASGKVQVTTKDGTFRLTGVCRDGGMRIYNSGSILSLSMQPNPASDVLNMIVTASEVGQHKITLTNTLGEEIGVLFDNVISGINEITGSLSDIPDGVYFVVLHSPSQVLTKRLLIAK